MKECILSEERDRRIIEILEATVEPYRLKLKKEYGIKSSAPYLIGEDRIGMFFFQENKAPLIWDCMIENFCHEINSIQSLMAERPCLGDNGLSEARGEEHESAELFQEAFSNLIEKQCF